MNPSSGSSLDILFDFLESPAVSADARSLVPKDTSVSYQEVEAYACRIPAPRPGIPDGLQSKTARVAYVARIARFVWPVDAATMKKAVAPVYGCDGEAWTLFTSAFAQVNAGGSHLSLLEWLYWRMDNVRGNGEEPPKLDKEGNPKPRRPHYPWKVLFDAEAVASGQTRAICHRATEGRFVGQTLWPIAARALYEVASGAITLGPAELAHFKAAAAKQQRLIHMTTHPPCVAQDPHLWLAGATVVRDLGLEEVATTRL